MDNEDEENVRDYGGPDDDPEGAVGNAAAESSEVSRSSAEDSDEEDDSDDDDDDDHGEDVDDNNNEDEEEEFPLLRALLNDEPMSAIRAIVNRRPESVRERNDSNKVLPIHVAAERHPLKVVKFLTRKWRGGLREQTTAGMLALHLAARDNSVEVVEFLASKYRGALQTRNMDFDADAPYLPLPRVEDTGRIEYDGVLPLHVAARESTFEVVSVLAGLYPGALQARDLHGYLPLHHASGRDSDAEEIVGFLLKEWRPALMVVSRSGLLPISIAVNCQSEWVADLLAHAEPRALQTKDEYGQTPLHLEAAQISVPIAQSLVEAWPPALLEPDVGRRMLPLHIAVEHSTTEMVQFLARAEPRALRVPLEDETLALHVACELRNDRRRPRVIQCLAEEWSGATQVRSEYQSLPLHSAARYAELEDVQFLVGQYPEALRVRGAKGMLPIHFAAQKPREDGGHEGLEFLLHQYPEALRLRSEDQSLPLHYAAQDAEPGKVQLLVREYPAALHARGARGMLPLHCAARGNSYHGRSQQGMEFLFREYPQALHVRDDQGYLPVHHVAQTRSLRNEISDLETVQFLVSQGPEIAQERTDAGELPLHLAVESCSLTKAQYLVGENRRALQMGTLRGWLPMHYAARGISLQMIRYVASEHPAALQVPTTDDGSLPLHVAARRSQSLATEELEVVRCVAELWPPALDVCDRQGFRPVLVAACKDDAKLDVVYVLLRMRPDALVGRDDDEGIAPTAERPHKLPRTG